MNYRLSEIAAIIEGRLVGEDRVVSLFDTDTRSILNPQQSVFIALRGERHDGRDFVSDAIASGVRSFIVEEVFRSLEGASFIVVEDSLNAFKRLAQQHRSYLEQHGHQTQVSINLQALIHNLNTYRSLLEPGVKVMAMVKAFGYGSGDVEVARILQYHAVDYLGVAYPDEGISLRQQGVELPIMVLNSSASEFAKLIKHRLEPEIYSMEILLAFDRFLAEYDIKHYPIHLKFDTGMHRLGFATREAAAVIAFLQSSDRLAARSVFSHLFSSDTEDQSMAKEQIVRFKELRANFQTNYGKPLMYHILNSAGISRLAGAQMDMVRLGLGLYGTSLDSAFSQKLLPVVGWTSVISQINEVPQGETVGYGGEFRADRDLQIAVIAAGYADGVSRLLGNGKGHVLIRGTRCPFVGNICMDMSMVDITGLACTAGDKVTLIGPGLRIEEMAEERGTITYEVLTSIPPRVKRVYVFEE